MSLSDSANDSSTWGTIFMGPEPMRETTLSRIEGANSGPQWNEETEAEYMNRVKARAVEKAAEILRNAQAEAADLREQARQEGYQQGINEAQAELEEFRAAAGQTTAAVLSAIESQAGSLTRAWEGELCALVRFAVEAAIGHELGEKRAEILKSLFFEAVAALEHDKKAVVHTSREDEAVVADIVSTAGEDYARRFQVRGNPGLGPGCIVLESSLGMVENNMDNRRALVNNILSELALSGPNNLNNPASPNNPDNAPDPNITNGPNITVGVDIANSEPALQTAAAPAQPEQTYQIDQTGPAQAEQSSQAGSSQIQAEAQLNFEENNAPLSDLNAPDASGTPPLPGAQEMAAQETEAAFPAAAVSEAQPGPEAGPESENLENFPEDTGAQDSASLIPPELIQGGEEIPALTAAAPPAQTAQPEQPAQSGPASQADADALLASLFDGGDK